MRIVPYSPLFTTMKITLRRTVLHRRRDLLAVHEEVAVAAEGNDGRAGEASFAATAAG